MTVKDVNRYINSKINKGMTYYKVCLMVYDNEGNLITRTSLNFKNLNQVIAEYFSKCNICLDN